METFPQPVLSREFCHNLQGIYRSGVFSSSCTCRPGFLRLKSVTRNQYNNPDVGKTTGCFESKEDCPVNWILKVGKKAKANFCVACDPGLILNEKTNQCECPTGTVILRDQKKILGCLDFTEAPGSKLQLLANDFESGKILNLCNMAGRGLVKVSEEGIHESFKTYPQLNGMAPAAPSKNIFSCGYCEDFKSIDYPIYDNNLADEANPRTLKLHICP